MDDLLLEGGGRASLRFEKHREHIDSFRGFLEKFSLFSNRSEALEMVPSALTCYLMTIQSRVFAHFA